MTHPRYIVTIKNSGRHLAIDPDKTDKFFSIVSTLTGIDRPMAEVILHGGKGIDHRHFKFTAAEAKRK